MSIVRCVHCQEEVRVPARVSPQATVECPRCGEHFELSAALDALPPLLVVIDDPGASSSSEEPADFELGPSVPKFEFEERDAPAAISVSRSSGGSSVASRARRRESSSGTILSAIAVIGGGACALPLAQIVLWWVFGQDPVELGPTVSQYVSFIVPAKFRAPADDGSTWEQASEDTDTNERPRPERVAAPPVRQPAGPGSGGGSSESTTTTTDTAGGGGGLAIGLGPSPLDNPPVVRPIRARPERLGDLAEVSEDELNTLLNSVILAQEDWLDAATFSDDERATRLDDFYAMYCELAEALARYVPADVEQDTLLGSIDQTLRFELDDNQLRTFLANRASTLLAEEDSADRGVALVGKIVAVEPGEELDMLVLKLGEGNGKTVRVASWLPLPNTVAKDRSAVVLGRVDTAEHMGWDPAAARGSVVLGGYVLLLPDAAD